MSRSTSSASSATRHPSSTARPASGAPGSRTRRRSSRNRSCSSNAATCSSSPNTTARANANAAATRPSSCTTRTTSGRSSTPGSPTRGPATTRAGRTRVAVLVTSEAVRRFTTAALRAPLPMHTVRVIVEDPGGESVPKRRVIAVMPRKRRHEAEAVVQLIRRIGPAGWDIAVIDKMSHAEGRERPGGRRDLLELLDRRGIRTPPGRSDGGGLLRRRVHRRRRAGNSWTRDGARRSRTRTS